METCTETVTCVREKLAEYAHERWSGWMNFLFKESIQRDDGLVIIPESLVIRWKRQMNTPYNTLPVDEKMSDRVEADTILRIVHGG